MDHNSVLRSKLIRGIGVVLAVFVILAGISLWVYNPLKLGCPKDRELIVFFRDHREALERLRTMAIEDSRVISYVSEDTLKQSSLSEARRNEYMRLLLGIKRNLVMGVDADEVSFSYWSGGVGLAIARSWMKGIAYLPNGSKKVGQVVSSLDKLPASDGIYLVPIEGNWYVAYSQLD